MISKPKLDEKEFEKIVLELGKGGLTSEKIGLALKKEYGIGKAKKVYGKRISDVLKESKIYVDADIANIKKRRDRLKEHSEKNRGDKICKRALMIKEAKLRKLVKIQK